MKKSALQLAALKRIGSTPSERSETMSLRRKIGWSRKTKAERLAHSKLMTLKRWPKVV